MQAQSAVVKNSRRACSSHAHVGNQPERRLPRMWQTDINQVQACSGAKCAAPGLSKKRCRDPEGREEVNYTSIVCRINEEPAELISWHKIIFHLNIGTYPAEHLRSLIMLSTLQPYPLRILLYI